MKEELLTKCSRCESEIRFWAEYKIINCPRCGQPNERPKSSRDEPNLNKLKYANERRNMGEFAEAEKAYRDVLAHYNNEHEARWGILLCKYGVIYVEGTDNHKRLITCRKEQKTLFSAEDDYHLALAQASPEVREAYKTDAQYIDDVQRSIRTLKPHAESYDVFLCYKETASEGGVTEDAGIAQAIYQQMTKRGYHVFYAKETLAGKAGANYEAVIYLAIEKSRAMLVIGTRKEYFNSIYVRSEWRRFKERMNMGDGEERLLIPLFRRIDDLPDEIRPYQGYNMNLPYMEQVYALLPQNAAVESKTDDSVIKKIKLARIRIRRGEFQPAEETLNPLFDEDPENAQIWLLKAMIGMRIRNEAEFSSAEQPLTNNLDFVTALELASGTFLEQLKTYQETVEKKLKEAEDKARKESEEKAHRETEEKAQKEAEDKARKDAEENIAEKIRKDGLASIIRYEGNNANVTENAEEAVAGNFGYYILNDGSAEITEYRGSSKRIKVPASISGHAVKKIGVCAFKNSQIISVNLPDGIVEIDEEAFAGCNDLRSITLPYGTEKICDGAFSGCSALSSITIPYSVKTVSNSAFDGCEKLTIHGENESVACKFASNHSLQFIDILEGFTYEELTDGTIKITGKYSGDDSELVIPGHIQGKPVTQLRENAFMLKNYSKIIISSGVVRIGEGCFYRNNALCEIEIPDTVTEISKTAFQECKKLKRITIPGNLVSLNDGVFRSCTSLEEVILPSGLLNIGKSAFAFCESLSHITLPNSVVSIGDYAFEECHKLEKIIIPQAIAEIGEGILLHCVSLTAIEVDKRNKNYCSVNGVLYSRDLTMLIQYPAANQETVYHVNNGTQVIGNGAFSGCQYLIEVFIPETVEQIEKAAFGHCNKLERIVVDLRNNHFASVDGVLFDREKKTLIAYPAGKPDKLYEVPAGTETIAEAAFLINEGLSEINVPDNVTHIGERAFWGCKALQRIKLSNSLEKLSAYIFLGCEQIESIIVPPKVISIGVQAFAACTGLQTISLPESLSEIGEEAFNGCKSLQIIVIPDHVKKIGSGGFAYCTKLEKLYLGNSLLEAENSLFQDCQSLSSIRLPGTLAKIADFMFRNCTSLVSVEIDEGIQTIGQYAFMKCTSLKTITIPKSATTIEMNAFEECSSLTTVEIGDGAQTIDSGVFRKCTSLKSLTIPRNISEIGIGAFEGCSNLETIEIEDGSEIRFSSYDFRECDRLRKICIPSSVTEVFLHDFQNHIGLTVYGTSGSAAEEAAKLSDIPFIDIDAQVHPSEVINKQGATKEPRAASSVPSQLGKTQSERKETGMNGINSDAVLVPDRFSLQGKDTYTSMNCNEETEEHNKKRINENFKILKKKGLRYHLIQQKYSTLIELAAIKSDYQDIQHEIKRLQELKKSCLFFEVGRKKKIESLYEIARQKSVDMEFDKLIPLKTKIEKIDSELKSIENLPLNMPLTAMEYVELSKKGTIYLFGGSALVNELPGIIDEKLFAMVSAYRWIAVSANGNKLLLLSLDAYGPEVYNTKSRLNSSRWQDSSLRRKCQFLLRTFFQEEQDALIAPSFLSEDDLVFCLSKREVEEYLQSEHKFIKAFSAGDRDEIIHDYHQEMQREYVSWWLRREESDRYFYEYYYDPDRNAYRIEKRIEVSDLPDSTYFRPAILIDIRKVDLMKNAYINAVNEASELMP